MILIDNNYFRIKIDPEDSINLMKTSDASTICCETYIAHKTNKIKQLK